MVFHGKSGGCATCKKRRIKCDESLPSCLRCQKIGKRCPGYPAKWDVIFHDENESVQARERSRDPESIHTSLEKTPSLQSLMKFDVDVQQHATCLFFRDYVLPQGAGSPGFLSFLPGLYQHATEDSALHQALCAAAYANFAQKAKWKEVAIKAMTHYRKSLETVNAALCDRLGAISDSTMTAVTLLGLYECINSTFDGDGQFRHSYGLGILADIRGSLLSEGHGLQLLGIVCCQMQRRNLELRLPPGPEDERLVMFLDSRALSSRMVANMLETSKFMARAKVETASICPAYHSDDPVVSMASKVEQQFLQWNEDAFKMISYHTLSESYSYSSMSTSGSRVDDYPNFYTAAIWNQHRATRILFHQTLLESLDPIHYTISDEHWTESESWRTRDVSLSVIQEMISDVFASIPCSLGDVPSQDDAGLRSPPQSIRGYFLVWVLKIIFRCPFASSEQQDKAAAVLMRIGRDFGVSYASRFVQASRNRRRDVSRAYVIVEPALNSREREIFAVSARAGSGES